MSKRFDVIGIGVYSIDFLGILPSFPKPDSKNRMVRFTQQGGGLVATALVTLARLGAEVSFIGKFGDNVFSHLAINEFIKEKVDISGMIREENAGPYIAFIIVDEEKGDRTICWTDQLFSPIKKEELSRDFITSCHILHLDEHVLLETALLAASWAKEKGIKTMLDAEDPTKKELLPLIKLIDFLIIPEDFALGFSNADNVENAINFFLKQGPQVVVITEGERGSITATEDKRFFQPAFKVNVIDTTGCGDVFHGAFIYGLLRNWPIEVVSEFASAVAAIKCTKLGGRAGCPSFEKVRGFLLSFGSEKMKFFLTSE